MPTDWPHRRRGRAGWTQPRAPAELQHLRWHWPVPMPPRCGRLRSYTCNHWPTPRKNGIDAVLSRRAILQDPRDRLGQPDRANDLVPYRYYTELRPLGAAVIAMWPEPVEIGGQDDLGRRWRDPEVGQACRVRRDDVVDLEQPDL